MFEEYLNLCLKDTDELYYNFKGISRKEFPKWVGWKVINNYKAIGVDIKEIEDDNLNILVRNFYYLKYIKENYSNPPSSII